MPRKTIKLDNPEVLNCLNGFLSKKSATVLWGVSSIMKKCIFPKKYRDKMLLFDTSDIAKMKMFIEWNDMDCTFYELFSNLKIFRYITTRFHHWNKYHWAFLHTFIFYRYIYHENLLINPDRFYVSVDLINFLEVLFPLDIKNIYSSCIRFPSRNTPELIML